MTRAVDSFANWTYFKNEHPAVKSRRYLKVRNFLTCQESGPRMKEQKDGFGIALGHRRKKYRRRADSIAATNIYCIQRNNEKIAASDSDGADDCEQDFVKRR